MSFIPQGTFYDLNMMGGALNAFQYAESVTSNNIANVNTPGASRQSVILNEAPPIAGSPFSPTHSQGTVGDGVLVQQILRIHADNYDQLFRGASSSQNFYSTEQNTLNALQSTLGDPNSGIGAQYTAFQTAINQLVAQGSGAQSTSVRASVIAQAQALSTALNNASSAIVTQQNSALSQATTLVTTANGILDQIGALNGQIRAATAAGDSPNTYQDQRDYLIDQLSQYLSTQTSIQSDGSVLVSVNGQALVNDTVVYHLAAPTIGTASNGTSTFKINFQSTPPASSSAPGIPLGSGQLAALQDLYNNKLTVYGQQLDQFASSLANEVNRITQSAFDQNGQAGAALFQPIVGNLPISAGNIKAGITDPAQLPIAFASTAAGSLVIPMNSGNNSIDTSASLTNYASLANPPTAPLVGTLTVTINGIPQTFNYNTGTTDGSVNAFVTHFNSAHLGVTASFDPNSQRIIFAQDPTNVDPASRAVQGGAPQQPGFTISDSLDTVPGTTPPAQYLLGVLGAGAIDGVGQNAGNAFGAQDNSGANALLSVFSANVGVPALLTTSATAATAGTPTTVALPSGVNNIAVGQVLTIDATSGGGAPQENVVVSAISVDPTTGIESVTFTPSLSHVAGYSVQSAQTQTLGQFYGNFVTRVGLDGQAAISGNQTQTTLANNINQVRQSISGININEETQNLVQYQNAYSAAARTINVINQMMQTLINNLGVGS